MESRYLATLILYDVIIKKHSLTSILEQRLKQASNKNELPFIKMLCYGVCRQFYKLDAILALLIKKPFKEKDHDLYCLLLLGIYQLLEVNKPAYTSINETVNQTLKLKKPWAKNLVNACLRNFQRNETELLNQINKNLTAKYSHPTWIIESIKKHWPSQWESILTENNLQPPLTLRVNKQKISSQEYLTKYPVDAKISPFIDSSLTLSESSDVQDIPGFQEGYVSVQNTSAQLAANLLELQVNQVVLDACAAPGGKTCHILEIQPKLNTLIALDNNEERLEKIAENLNRLSLNAQLIVGDASTPETWAKQMCFDRILLDAPCSATGVIRHHPDIKILRTKLDIEKLVSLQNKILSALWPLLKNDGILVYATCSILAEENHYQIENFLHENPDAAEIKIAGTWGIDLPRGKQILPHEDWDGFYYAKLKKTSGIQYKK